MRKMNNAASSNQAMNGAAVARKAPTTQSFQVLGPNPDITPRASNVRKMLPKASLATSR
jgi:hypothetical protein